MHASRIENGGGDILKLRSKVREPLGQEPLFSGPKGTGLLAPTGGLAQPQLQACSSLDIGESLIQRITQQRLLLLSH
jgi:hypothetical protein